MMFVAIQKEERIEWWLTLYPNLSYLLTALGIFATMRYAKTNELLNGFLLVILNHLTVFGLYEFYLRSSDEKELIPTLDLIFTRGTLISLVLVPIIYLLIKKLKGITKQ